MVHRNGNDFPQFEKNLTTLKPIIMNFTNNNQTRIIWKTQAPTPWLAHESDAKVPHYNNGVRAILK